MRSFVFLGLSITSTWGNGHASTYRALCKALERRGHEVMFLERDLPWYAQNRDLQRPALGRVGLYADLDELRRRFAGEVRDADVVLVGSYVPDGVAVSEWVIAEARGLTVFYDLDAPVTVRKLERREHDYLSAPLVSRYQLYLSSTGGPLLERLSLVYGARRAAPLYCACDAELHRPDEQLPRWDLGYLGTYSPDRQPALERLLGEPARAWRDGRFALAGSQYPERLSLPPNVERLSPIPPPEHAAFYAAQRFTLNVTRPEMAQAGFSPSVRLFEAAACGTPIISDWWPGLDHFFQPGRELLLARSPEEVLRNLRALPEESRRTIAERARARTLREHTSDQRAETLERYVSQIEEATWPRSW
jgi:spore maturation protein CgeB